MMDVLSGIKKNAFVVVGRVGIDFSPEPAGTGIETAETMMQTGTTTSESP